jgi:hypothetical protein
MRLSHTLALLLTSVASLTCASAASEEVALPTHSSAATPAPVTVPARGQSMSQIEAKFGAPTERHAVIGNPPITRWDYPSFSVFFEHQHVVHTVVK